MTYQPSFLLRDLQISAQEAVSKRDELFSHSMSNASTAKAITRSFFKQRALNRLSNRLKLKYNALNNSLAAESKQPEHQQEIERIARER